MRFLSQDIHTIWEDNKNEEILNVGVIPSTFYALILWLAFKDVDSHALWEKAKVCYLTYNIAHNGIYSPFPLDTFRRNILYFVGYCTLYSG